MKPRVLEDGLVLRNATPEDVPAIITHVRTVHGEEVVGGIKAMYESHPRMSWEDTFVVADDDAGVIVSSLVLLPGTWRLDGVTVPVAQMEAVGTLKDYRHRGFINLLNQEFEKRIGEICPVIQVIAGIPHFYRNFGYDYAADLGGAYPVTPGMVPQLPKDEKEPVHIEAVDEKNLKEYLAYRNAHLPAGTWVKAIEPEDFQYYNFDVPDPKTEGWFFNIIRENDKVVGVFILSRWESRLDIVDFYLDTYSHADSVLRFALARSEGYAGQSVRVVPPNQEVLREFIQARTGTAMRQRYAWYVKIPSVERFLKTIAPLVKTRLSASDYRDHEGELKVTDYRRGFAILIEKGSFAGIREVSERDPNAYDLRLSKSALTRLLMGYETIDELQTHEPDAICRATMLPLVRRMFPKIGATVDPFY